MPPFGAGGQRPMRPAFNHQGPPAGPWRGNQFRPQRAANMIWSDPSFFCRGPRPPPPPYPGGADSTHHGGRGRGGGRGGWRGRGRGFHQRGGHGGQGGNNNGNGGQNFASKKKQKVDKRDLPENNQFHCEVCDRGFKTADKYQEHCSVKGCPYVAAPKLVQLHVQTQHKTGMARKIWSLESPEDIEKWIQERKRNYPTKTNVARKQQQSTDRQARGEVLETKQFGKFRGQGRRRGRAQHRNKGQDTNTIHDNQYGSAQHQRESDEPVTKTAQKRLLQQGSDAKSEAGGSMVSASSPKKQRLETPATASNASGLNQTSDTKGSKDTEELASEKDSRDPLSFLITGKPGSEDESEASSDSEDAEPQLLLRGGLGSLMSSYNTDDNSDDEEVDTSTKEEAKEEHSRTTPKAASCEGQGKATEGHHKQHHREKEPPSPKKVSGQTSSPSSHHHKKPARDVPSQNPVRGKKNSVGVNTSSRKPTLLERLLANEIRHERNVILQCVHYIVSHNFLGVSGGKRGDS
ncbi:hypothetical protein BaRGS_00023906 [Batillaria attramentaria]|uniref:FMR1-interacting protein 1 conserved domain-containing protein n=1 Tax=Batillaria attramentaria TaxID=370345 RepID=A0ABD0KCQ2_9CAEN